VRNTDATTKEHARGTETLLYGLPKGETERYTESLLSTNPARFDEIKRLASADGWHSFRIATITLGELPDFVGSLSFARGKTSTITNFNRKQNGKKQRVGRDAH
jgi:hypothetical protein